MRWLCLMLLAVQAAPSIEPPARTPTRVSLQLEAPLTHVSAARELPDGRILVTNARQPAVLLVDPSTGLTTRIGEPGAGPDRYSSPGGLYAGPEGSTLVVDRGRFHALTISSSGALTGSRSIAIPGWNQSTDRDIDLQRLDARGAVYYQPSRRLAALLARGGAPAGGHEATIARFDPDSRTSTPIAIIRQAEVRYMPAGDNVLIGRQIIGSPADGWGVAPDGRVAVVRAEPYRVEWYASDGKVVRGDSIPVDRLPMTEEDKRAHAASSAGTGPSVGKVGGGSGAPSRMDPLFAETKPPFSPDGVLVSPDARVWVLRTRPYGASGEIYDVFDEAGTRVDRLALPDGSRIVGFGRGSILVRWLGDDGRCELRKYRLR